MSIVNDRITCCHTEKVIGDVAAVERVMGSADERPKGPADPPRTLPRIVSSSSPPTFGHLCNRLVQR